MGGTKWYSTDVVKWWNWAGTQFLVSLCLMVLAYAIFWFPRQIMAVTGMLEGEEGVRYYTEVHQSKFNCYIHTMFMPSVAYGFVTALPGILRVSAELGLLITITLFFAYTAHYITIDPNITALFVAVYAPVVALAVDYLEKYGDEIPPWKRGIKIMVVALFIQEIVGHWIGGDNPSRIEGIPNAIVYAMYFSVSHSFN